MIRAIPETDGGGKISRCPLVPYFSLFLLTTYVYIIIVNDATCIHVHVSTKHATFKKSLDFPTFRYDFFFGLFLIFYLILLWYFGEGAIFSADYEGRNCMTTKSLIGNRTWTMS